jgi:TRAP-type C4-dicarboxylate transport system substrate-binding protein
VTALIFGGCAEPAPAPAPALAPEPTPAPAPAPTPAPTPAPAPAPEPEAKALKLIYSASFGESHPTIVPQLRWLDMIESETNGRVKFERFLGGALSTSQTAMKDLRKGVWDVGTIIAPHEPDVFPIASSCLKFFYGAKDRATNTMIYKQVLDEFPAFTAEYDGGKPLLFMTAGPFCLVSKVPIYTLEDFRGLQLRTIGPFMKDTFEALGASPVSIPVGEVYISMQKNLVDGVLKGPDAIKADSLAEVAEYSILLNLHEGGGQVMLFRQEVFDSLPPDIQGLIEDSLPDLETDFMTNYDAYVAEAEDWAVKEYNHQFIELPAEEMAQFYELVGNEGKTAAADLDAKGLPGTQIYERVRQLVEETK